MNLLNLRPDYLRLALTGLVTLLILWQRLLVPVLLGMLVYAWSCLLADRLAGRFGVSRTVSSLSGALVGTLVCAAFAGLVTWTVALASGEELRTFLARIEDSLDALRIALPASLAESIPNDLVELRTRVFDWLREHAASIGGLGSKVAHALAQGIFAILVGAMAAAATWRPGMLMAKDRFLGRLLLVLERVVLAQGRIALFNTTMTALYLYAILPAFGYVLPFRGLLCLFTLVTGIMPVAGNLLANLLMTMISLAVSPKVAIASLVFLVAIHKAEYFINARTVGSQVQVSSWEILAAMLTGEALFGVQGLVAAPLVYPFFKREIARLREPGGGQAGADSLR
ncbi:MAG: AI-2E family transporter [Burkholderiales bacterium]